MEHILRALDRVPECARGSSGHIPLAVVIRLPMRSIRASKFPIDLIQIVGLEHDATDHALAGGSFEPNLDFAAEDVEFGLHSRRIAFGIDGKLSALVVVVDSPRSRIPGFARGGFGEVVNVAYAERRVGRTVGLV